MGTMEVNIDRTSYAIQEDYILATDLADYLVKKGVPFRQAHSIVGELMCYVSDQGRNLHQIDLEEYQRFSALFQEDVYSITTDSSIAARNITGGTAPQQVEAQLARARKILSDTE